MIAAPRPRVAPPAHRVRPAVVLRLVHRKHHEEPAARPEHVESLAGEVDWRDLFRAGSAYSPPTTTRR